MSIKAINRCWVRRLFGKITYKTKIMDEAHKIFRKLAKKDKNQLRTVQKKIKQISSNPFHNYKFLRKPLHMFNRVHIEKHFVLIFKIDHIQSVVEFHHYKHHDTVYTWKP